MYQLGFKLAVSCGQERSILQALLLFALLPALFLPALLPALLLVGRRILVAACGAGHKRSRNKELVVARLFADTAVSPAG